MKKVLTWVSMIVLSTNVLFGQTGNPALDYLNAMANEFKAIQSSTWDYTKSTANNKSARKTNKKRIELVQQIDASTKNVSKLPAFEKKIYLKDSVLSYLRIQKIVISEDYSKIMDLEDVAESSYDAMEAYLKAREIANEKLQESYLKVDGAYTFFAKEHNINLVESKDDKVAAQLRIADEVYTYYNEIYLIFFKAYKQEAYLLDALSKGDLAGVEQNKVSLSTVSSACQAKLKVLQPFRNSDNSLRAAATEMVNFYKNEADVRFAKLIDFQIKKEAFDKAKKAFESNNNKSNDDVNTYNKLINEMNAASGEFNKTNADLYKQRSTLLNEWNTTSQNFTAKYL